MITVTQRIMTPSFEVGNIYVDPSMDCFLKVAMRKFKQLCGCSKASGHHHDIRKDSNQRLHMNLYQVSGYSTG
jgi:hypothetical protein